jgi:hypothetical protein
MKANETETKKAARGSASVRPCTCANEYQDQKYGAGRRVHNTTKDGHRCTSCGTKK